MSQYGSGVIEKQQQDLTVEIDGKNATISAELKDDSDEKLIYTNPIELMKEGTMPSLSLIRYAKVKNFIDGVYAVMEERVAERGHDLSREDFLTSLDKLIEGKAKIYIVQARSEKTQEDRALSLPQGFYDWSPVLKSAYQQIKILSRRPGYFFGDENNDALNEAVMNIINGKIKTNEQLCIRYNLLNDLYAKMSGKPEQVDCLFPSAELPDQKYFKKMSYMNANDLPQSLGVVLVQGIKEGNLSVEVDEDSGLYVRQMQEIFPLILRNTEEFRKYIVDDKYAKVLENEFIAQWATTRHTHVGHSSFHDMLIGAHLDYRPTMYISPQIDVEPFSTSYEKMRENLSFLKKIIKNEIPEILERRRYISEGEKSEIKIDEEFEEMDVLLKGLMLIAKDSVHLTYDASHAEKAIEKAKNWISIITEDLDVNRNTATFVPIIRTTDGSKQISYANVGFRNVPIKVSYKDKPIIRGDDLGFDCEFTNKTINFPFLVTKEIRIPTQKLINDKGLRDRLPSSFNESELEEVLKSLE